MEIERESLRFRRKLEDLALKFLIAVIGFHESVIFVFPREREREREIQVRFHSL